MYKATRAKNLRRNSTDPESRLWHHLKNRGFYNLKFRRQCPIENYITDFVCFEKRLIIELDGDSHGQKKQIEKDVQRDKFFEDNNFKVLRFWNNEIKENIEGVLTKIAIEAGIDIE